MYIINTHINNTTIQIKFKRQQHALKYAMEVALRQNKAGVRLVKQERVVRAVEGHLYAWVGASVRRDLHQTAS